MRLVTLGKLSVTLSWPLLTPDDICKRPGVAVVRIKRDHPCWVQPTAAKWLDDPPAYICSHGAWGASLERLTLEKGAGTVSQGNNKAGYEDGSRYYAKWSKSEKDKYHVIHLYVQSKK